MSGLEGIAMSDWMIDTFVYTALLIGVVLLVRRPVTQHFGPQIAYALWALPLLRFIMPPIVLPAWMAPAPEPAVPAAADTAGTAETGEALLFILPEATASAGTAAPAAAVDVTSLLLPLWLGGALVFIGWRVRDYYRMRRDLLAEARPVGEAGKIRLVETPAVSAPVAFGIRDKVVALPVDFMALLDVNARDMAIDHELEHHRGHDLLANIAAQPLLALHWFNPLAWWGWRAMRRDQEAACDARVVAGRARSERAAYAEVIAGFAAGEHLALAAPMACPVLGEKSIIHRLRSLTMNDVSSSRRKLGIAAITTTALALPLTASISYAAADAPQPPLAQEAPEAPEAPQPPAAPAAPEWQDGDYEWEDEDGNRRIVIRTVTGEDGERHVMRRVIRHNGEGHEHEMSEEEIAELMAEVEAELADLDIELANLDGMIEEQIAFAMRMSEEAGEMSNRVMIFREGDGQARRMNIECDGENPVVERELDDGRTALMICQSQINAEAAEGIEEAISEIRNDPDVPAEMRERIIRQLERSIERMRARQVSFRATPKAPRAPAVPEVRRTTVSFDASALAPRAIPMVSPVTGVSMAPNHEPDCEEEHTVPVARTSA